MKKINQFLKMCKPVKGFYPSYGIFSFGDGWLRYSNLNHYISFNTGQQFPAFEMDLKKFKELITSGQYTINQILEKFKPEEPTSFKPKDFPNLQRFMFSINNVDRFKSIAKICSKDPLRGNVACVYIKDNVAVATDAYVLIESKDCIRENKDYVVMIHREDIQLLNSKSYDVYDTDKDVEKGVFERYLILMSEDKNIWFAVKDRGSRFVNYKAVFPENNPYSFTFNVKDLLRHIKTSTLGYENPTIKIDFANNIITSTDCHLKLQTETNNTVFTSINPDSNSSCPVMMFTHKYIISALELCNTEKATISISEKNKPCLINQNIILMPKYEPQS